MKKIGCCHLKLILVKIHITKPELRLREYWYCFYPIRYSWPRSHPEFFSDIYTRQPIFLINNSDLTIIDPTKSARMSKDVIFTLHENKLVAELREAFNLKLEDIYNERRVHSKLDYLSPNEFEEKNEENKQKGKIRPVLKL
mgnify:CR=1 FL=1